MNKEIIAAALESDQLEVINGTVYWQGEPVQDPTPAESMVPNEFGMFGRFDEHYCRNNYWINDEVEKYANSGDADKEEAARRLAPYGRIMFFDTKEQLENAPDEIKAIYKKNRKGRSGHITGSPIVPLVDAEGVDIPGCYWPMIGNYSIPGATTRRGLERYIRYSIKNMLRNEYDRIKAGDGKLDLG